MNMSYSKKTMIWSVCAALCVVLPQTMRVIPNADAVYRAMQIPVLLCGVLCGPGGGVFCALTGVCVSALISGVPSVAMFPVILLELALMGIISGFTVKIFRASRGGAAEVYAVLFAVLLGRSASGMVAAMIFSPGRESMVLWIWGYIIAGLPSFVVQLILLPAIVRALDYSGVVQITHKNKTVAVRNQAVDAPVEDSGDKVKKNSSEDVV